MRLVPAGENPAVAGVDFVDEPRAVTLRRGDRSARLTFDLLENPELDAERTLTVTVSRAA